MTNVFAVVGQHRVVPGRLLLLGEDGRFYAYGPDGHPTEVAPSPSWSLDDESPAAGHRSSFDQLLPQPRAGGSRAERPRPARPRLLAHRAAYSLALGLALLVGLLAAAPSARAHGPALAVATSEAVLYQNPEDGSPVLAAVPRGTELELTGAAAGDYLEVMTAGQLGWVAVGMLDDGRLRTATLPVASSILAGPRADADALATIPDGATVILTGAASDGFLAASFAGVGGWVAAAALADTP